MTSDEVVPLAVFFALAVALAATASTVGVRSRKMGATFGALFASVERDRTFVGLVPIVRLVRTHRYALVIVAFAIAPTLSALAVSAAGVGAADLGDLLRRLALWRGDAGRAALTYALLVAGFAAGCWWFARVARDAAARGAVALPAVLRDRSRPDVAARLALGAVTDEGGTLEELGWRGFALPLLLAGSSRGTATLAVAVMWWAWHLPRETTAVRRKGLTTDFVSAQATFLGLCIALSVLCTAAVGATGSVWPAVILHGGTNVWSKALGAGAYQRYHGDVRTWIVCVLAIVVVVVWMAS